MTDPISLRLDPDTLRRIEAVALKKGKDPLALAKEFVVERLREEEKREGLLDLPDGAIAERTERFSDCRPPTSARIEIYTDGGARGTPAAGVGPRSSLRARRQRKSAASSQKPPTTGWSCGRPSRG